MFSRRMVLTIGGLFVVICCIILISISSKQPSATGTAGRYPVSIVSPFQDLITGSMHFLRDVWRHYFYLVQAAKENEELRVELGRAIEQNNQCIELEHSNKRLRTFLDFQRAKAGKVVAAEVVGRDPSPWYKTIIIDKGEADGVVKGLPVVVPEGVIGQVMSASMYYAKVLLMIDRNSAVDGLVQRTRARGLVRGKSEDRCLFQFVLRKHDIKAGDVVISSGLDGVFPKGLRIGRIFSVVKRNAGIFQDVALTPFVDFEKLEEVLVLMQMSEEEIVMP